MDLLGLATLVVTGFTACAELGSYAFVHPVARRLPPRHHITVEQGLLRTFGRVMPGLMTLCLVLAIADASRSGGEGWPPRRSPPPWRRRWCSTSRSTSRPAGGTPRNHPPTGSRPATAGSCSRASDRGCCCSASCWSASDSPAELAGARRVFRT